MATLPITSNNPFALIQPVGRADKWTGLIRQTPSGFLVFDTALNGTRAGFISFINTYIKRGINTIERIFPIYAPSSDPRNNPELYIQNVSKMTGIARNTPITTAEQIVAIGKAIIRVESGSDWIDNATLIGGYTFAAQYTGAPKLGKKSVRLAIPFLFFLAVGLIWISKTKNIY